jgi:O-antigen/teichoic acid export membrane protein
MENEFISYYTTAFSLASSVGVIISFISTGIFPILSSLTKNKLNILLKKALKYSLLISLLSSTIILLGANLIIHLLYGIEYPPAAIVLRDYHNHINLSLNQSL